MIPRRIMKTGSNLTALVQPNIRGRDRQTKRNRQRQRPKLIGS